MIENDATLARSPHHEAALESIVAGIEAADPRTVVSEALGLSGERLAVGEESYHLDEFENVVVLGGGKPAGHVAAALVGLLGDRIDGGLVVTDDPAEAGPVDIAAGTHPLPSAANVTATRRMLDRAGAATADDLVLVVVGGGGSALLCAPAADVSVDDYRATTDQLLDSGATIDEINAVRKHLSAIKGGQLARELAPATAVGLVFSDVVDDRLDVIASGPTAPDPTTYADAIAVLDRHGIDLPGSVESILESGARGQRAETPGAESPVSNHVLANNRTALDAAAAVCEQAGYTPAVLSAAIEGEARVVGQTQAAIARSCLTEGDPFEPPVALLSGGETTVTVRGDGRGGPNQEFALGAAIDLGVSNGGAATPEVVVAGVDTDGIDGGTDAAGAIVDETTVTEKRDGAAALAANDAFPYLDERNALVRTGPTGTNVNDLRVVLVGASK